MVQLLLPISKALKQILSSKITQSVLAFYLWLILVSPFSFFQKDSLIGCLKHLASLLAFLGFSTLIVLLKTLDIKQEKIIDYIFTFITAISGAFAILGLIQFLNGTEQYAGWDDINVLSTQTRVYSIFANPNLFGAFLIAVLPLNIYLFIKHKNSFHKVFYALITILNFMNLLFTGSRSSILAFLLTALISLFIFLLKNKRIKKQKIFIASITVLASFTSILYFINHLTGNDLIFNISERFKTIFMWDQYSTNNYRIEVWLACLNIIKDNWILGIGLGHEVFRKTYALYMVPPFEALSAYSIYLELLIESGIVGFILFCNIIFQAFKKLYSQLSYYQAALLLCLGSCILVLLLQGFVDTLFFRPSIQVLFWLIIALTSTLEAKS